MQKKPVCRIEDLDALRDETPLIIYGAGNAAKRTFEMLEAEQIAVACFCVTDIVDQEPVLSGKKVVAYSDLHEMYPAYQILIATSLTNTYQIFKTMEENNEKNKVYFFEAFEGFLALCAIHQFKKKGLKDDVECEDIPYEQILKHIQDMEMDRQMHQTILDVKNNIKEYEEMYSLMSDDLSKQVLKNLLSACLYQNNAFYTAAFCLNGFPGEASLKNVQYFCDGIFQMGEQEVFVQCGGFDGDTVVTYIKKYKSYKKIYVYEPTPGQFELTQKNLNHFADVIVRQKGVFDQKGKLEFTTSADSIYKSFNKITEHGNIEIETVKMDDDIKEPVTFIAMDIEGAEVPALLGARQHIETTLPKLAICVYHTPTALREIFLLIRQFSKKYKFYLRHHTIGCGETVLYATTESYERIGDR